jgi:phosphoribosylanthranilate isomerase
MFHIKICGVRTKDAIEAAAESGADAIGLNFFSGSIRYLDPGAATTRDLADHAAQRRLLRVGVFVNASAETIQQVVDQIGLDAIQLHGDEDLVLASELVRRNRVGIIRAIKLPQGALSAAQIEASTRPWITAGCHPLLDVDAGPSHGGSGKTLDWDSIHRWSAEHPRDPFTLAGGLDAENVLAAIRRSGTPSVDTASGVENPRGEKRRELIAAFVHACLGPGGLAAR